MRTSYKIYVFILILLATLLIVNDQLNTKYTGPTSLADPIQKDMTPETITHIDLNGNPIQLTLLASYTISCGIKGVKNYKTDPSASISPKDFIFTWGDLNQESVDEHITYSQSNRWYYYRYDGTSLVNGNYISTHSSNTHIIPANEQIYKEIKKIDENDYVSFDGYLVSVHFENGQWRSSMSREDTGDGACEIYYVTEVIRQ